MFARRQWTYGAAALACVALAWLSWRGHGFVPLLNLVDLGFHELGHLLAMPLPDSAMLVAGSLAQVAVPAGLTVYFWWWRRDLVGAVATLAWTGTSMRGVGAYMADATVRQLPLIGSGRHDWATLFGRWGVLDMAPNIGGLVGALGFVTIAVAATLALLAATAPSVLPQELVVERTSTGRWRALTRSVGLR